jgi:hypothetical protein
MAAAAKPASLAAALLKVQAEAPKLQKDSINPHFGNRYIGLDSLMPQVLPILNKAGVLLVQAPTNIGGLPGLTTKLVHVDSGETVEDTMPLLLDKQNSQGLGSAITYARRYALMSILGLVADEDDDGHKASRTVAAPAPAQATVEQADYAPAAVADMANTSDPFAGSGSVI